MSIASSPALGPYNADAVLNRSRRWVSYPCLLRDFLHEALYAKNEGYFSKNASIGIGNAGNPDTIHFPSLYDEADYHSHVSDMYTKVGC